MEKTNREGYYLSGDTLKKFLYSNINERDFIEVTAWDNKEGWTISINNDLGARTFELEVGEFNAIKFLIDKLDYNID